MSTGTVVSFDRIKGYGFVAPDVGGEDVFIHVNDLNDLHGDKALLGPGCLVEFRLEEGDRGPKATGVAVLAAQPQTPPHAQPEAPATASDADATRRKLTRAAFEHEVTECLLRVAPELTSGQILEIRKRLLYLAQSQGWSDR